ncbi:MAG: SusD/RagB family nutrient-binding outer membrane lipoprotein [Saprospiraceae bacterium]|jgi:hypothetical protein|nr:SusD/RagB family nutrient-binding outer membrane lipoprotein [Saprospiraceae bacterium]
MKNIIFNLIILAGFFMLSSCEFEQLENPNAVTLKSSDVTLLLNQAQRSFASFHSDVEFRGGAVTRMYHQSGDTYEIGYSAVNMNGPWSAYSGILQDIKVIKKLADEGKFKRHGGIAKILEAYVLMSLVDTYGDVPYSKAFDPNDFNPTKDSGDDVYKAALALLVSAQADLKDPVSVGTPNDFYYNTHTLTTPVYTKWDKLSNTLQLKYWLNRRLIDKAGATTAINALIAKNAFIAAGDEFVWRYGTSLTDPNTRAPKYQPNGGGDYMSNDYMWHLTESKGTPDPRAAYYFYRQVITNPTNASDVRCVGGEFPPPHYPVGMTFCLPGKVGYWGRDHLDPQGTPPDGLKRTMYGVYPAGGTYDNGTGGAMGATNQGSIGAGLEVIMLPAYVDFMLAEAANELGTTGTAKALLISGVTKHVAYVRSWSLSTNQTSRITAHKVDTIFNRDVKLYTDKVAAAFDAGADLKAKRRVIALEYWISLFGSGQEAYNLYRRTSQPDRMQLGQVANAGKFPRSFFYPADHIERNNQAQQKASHDVKVFWDTNPDKLD